MYRHLLFFLVFLVGTVTALNFAQARNPFLSSSLGSNMVLQRAPQSATLFGWSLTIGATITVTVSPGTSHTNTSASLPAIGGGYLWTVSLPPIDGSFIKHTIEITSSSSEYVSLTNVVFGEVFLCSGQSNMAFQVGLAFNATAEIASADNYPFIRIFDVGIETISSTPLDNLATITLPWTESNSKTVVAFSAVCWFYGRELYDGMLERTIPVGLISDCWPGSIIQSWVSLDVVVACGGYEDYDKTNLGLPSILVPLHVTEPRTTRFTKSEQGSLPYLKNKPYVDSNHPGLCYNAMIVPYQHMSFKGVVWYQGESNTNAFGGYKEYTCMWKGLVDKWRKLVGYSSLAFLFVQLAPWDDEATVNLAAMRNVQFGLNQPDEKMILVTAADLGDYESPFGNIHPRKKQEVSRRLGLAASTILYDKPQPYLGPIIQKITILDPAGVLELEFVETTCGTGIELRAPQECPAPVSAKGGCAYGLILFDNGSILQCNYVINGTNKIIMKVHNDDMIEMKTSFPNAVPKDLLYGQNDYPMLTIYNSQGVATIPFVHHFHSLEI